MEQEPVLSLEPLKLALVQVDRMDRFQVIKELSRFRLPIFDFADDEQEKLRLKKVLLEEIVKCDVENKSLYTETSSK